MIEVATLFLGIVLAQVSPGPNMIAVAQASLGSGRAQGVATAFGVATGVIVWSILFAFGIGALLQAVPELLTAMRLIGGGYLVYLGLRSVRSAFAGGGSGGAVREVRVSVPAAYRRGLLVVMTNPKAALMWVAIAMFLASSGVGAVQFLGIGIGASLSAALIYGSYAILFSTGVAVRGYRRFFRGIEGVFGALFGALGGKLVLDGVREIRGA